MRTLRTTLLSALAFAAVATIGGEATAQPFADDPDAKEKIAPRPERRTWTVKNGDAAFTFEFTPGIAVPNQVSEIIVFATAIPKTPHPRYGNRIPMKDASLTVEVINPAGESLGRFVAHPFELQAGRYGMHVTPTQEGIYELRLAGTDADGKKLSANLKMPVDVWPLPDAMKGSGDEVGGGPRVRRPIIKAK